MVAIFVVLTIVAFVLLDAAVQRKESRRKVLMAAPGSANVGSATIEDEAVPPGLFLHPAHTWVALQSSGATRVGMDHFAAQAIGHIDAIELPSPGSEVRQGEDLFVIRQGKRRAIFKSPVDGAVQSVNRNLEASATELSKDPYEKGWICILSPKNLAQSLRRLSVAEETAAWWKTELNRFREFVSSQAPLLAGAGPAMQDGGLVVRAMLEQMNDESWEQFGREFLYSRQ
jgi:glycine cleavage system H protein